MGHPAIEKPETCHVEPLFLADEDSIPALATLVRMTLRIEPDGALQTAPAQLPAVLAPEPNFDTDESSLKYESEAVLTKPSTDVVLIGHAHVPGDSAVTVDVGLKIGSLQKIVRVFGDRYWAKVGGRLFATKPVPFKTMPLVYERAFGGWDKADKNQSQWRYEPRNPVGRGFGDPLRFVEEGRVPMPNIEDPRQLITRYGDTPPPAGFGFVSANWQPRAQFAGTYDTTWEQSRKPLLPLDFDRRFFNAASPGLVAPGYLRGDEEVVIVNASPVPNLKFRLPGVSAPMCSVRRRGGRSNEVQTNLDTVIVDTDKMLVFLLWRNYLHVPNGPQDVEAIAVTFEHKSPAGGSA